MKIPYVIFKISNTNKSDKILNKLNIRLHFVHFMEGLFFNFRFKCKIH